MDKLAAVIEKYREVSPVKIKKDLSGKLSDEKIRLIISRTLLKNKIKAKFPSYPPYFLITKESFEQSSSEAIARYHSSLFSRKDILLEICSGCGGDSFALAKRVKKLFSIEANSFLIQLLKNNLKEFKNTVLLNTDLDNLVIPDTVTAVYADPSRRINGKRVKNIYQYLPSVKEILDKTAHIGKVIIKLSSVANHVKLLHLGNIELVSCGNEVKEALFIKDKNKAGNISAVIIDKNGEEIFRLSSNRSKQKEEIIKDPLTYIIEPDPSIIAGSLLKEFAHLSNSFFLEKNLAYLTSNKKYTNKRVATTYKVIAYMPFNRKKVKKFLKDKKISEITVKKRGLNKGSEDIKRLLSIKKESPKKYLLVYKSGKKEKAVIGIKEE